MSPPTRPFSLGVGKELACESEGVEGHQYEDW